MRFARRWRSHFTPPQWTSEIYETTGKEDEDVAAICRAACERGASLVISAGGDGTLVGVGNGLVNSPVPLGILPLGTGNDLARALLIPLKLDEAMDLLVSDHDVMEVDALKVGERHFFSNVSVGISPEMMSDTKSADKKTFGSSGLCPGDDQTVEHLSVAAVYVNARWSAPVDPRGGGDDFQHHFAREAALCSLARLKRSTTVNWRSTWSRRKLWAITCGWCGTCSAGRASRRRSYPTWPPRIPFALRPTVPIWSRRMAK